LQTVAYYYSHMTRKDRVQTRGKLPITTVKRVYEEDELVDLVESITSRATTQAKRVCHCGLLDKWSCADECVATEARGARGCRRFFIGLFGGRGICEFSTGRLPCWSGNNRVEEPTLEQEETMRLECRESVAIAPAGCRRPAICETAQSKGRCLGGNC
jgi:hypothetical protein